MANSPEILPCRVRRGVAKFKNGFVSNPLAQQKLGGADPCKALIPYAATLVA